MVLEVKHQIRCEKSHTVTLPRDRNPLFCFSRASHAARLTAHRACTSLEIAGSCERITFAEEGKVMDELWLEHIEAWREFYLLVGTAGAALVGLMFVVVSLGRTS